MNARWTLDFPAYTFVIKSFNSQSVSSIQKKNRRLNQKKNFENKGRFVGKFYFTKFERVLNNKIQDM
jgi:hypothetical protein